jgi:hypothetical protein
MDRAIDTAAGILLALAILFVVSWFFGWTPVWRHTGIVQADAVRHFNDTNGGREGLTQWCDSQHGVMRGNQCIK